MWLPGSAADICEGCPFFSCLASCQEVVHACTHADCCTKSSTFMRLVVLLLVSLGHHSCLAPCYV